MGNTVFIIDKRACIKPSKTRLLTIQKLKPPMKAKKNCQLFTGVIDDLSMICPNLQKLLKAIYDLRRKGRPFILIKMYKESFEDSKARLLKTFSTTSPKL